MLENVLVFAGALVAAIAVFVLTRPAEFRVSRSATMAAPPAAVFEQVNALERWAAWSPWQAKDPQMKQTYAGPPAGEGASLAWSGNREVGEGRLTIVESRAPERLRLRLEFFKPFAAVNSAEFAFAPEGEGTRVTWTMQGRNGLPARVLSLFMNFDAMIGGDFEKGLAALKAVVEKRP